MRDSWKNIVLQHESNDERSMEIVIEAIEKYLRYDTSTTDREDIDEHFTNDRIENLAMKGLIFYNNNRETLDIMFPKDDEKIIDIVRAELAGFQPHPLTFDITTYEVWRDNLLQSKSIVWEFYARVDKWLRSINKKPLVTDELPTLQSEYVAYCVKHEEVELEEWLQKHCKVYFTRGYDNSIWRNLKYKLEDCTAYDFFRD